MNENCEVPRIVLEILRLGLLRIRADGWAGKAAACAREADHIHNLPELLESKCKKSLLLYYWHTTRPCFIEECGGKDVGMFESLWAELERHVEPYYRKMAARFSPRVLSILQGAGWFEGRDVSAELISPRELGLFPAAERVVREFGCLQFGECGPGMDCATSDVLIDPRLAVHLLPELKKWERAQGVRLFPLGEMHRSHGYLVIDEHGRTYMVVENDLVPLAPSYDEGIERLLLGRRPNSEEGAPSQWPQ
jgi:hypothetical protein